jgi:hypothetical protein
MDVTLANAAARQNLGASDMARGAEKKDMTKSPPFAPRNRGFDRYDPEMRRVGRVHALNRGIMSASHGAKEV